MDSGFRRKDGRGGGVYGNSWANGHWGATWIPAFAGMTGRAAASTATRGQTDTVRRRGFRLSPERRAWWRCLRQLAGKRTPWRRRGFRLSPERRAWWRCLRQLVGIRTLGAAWIPAFAGKTGVVAVSTSTRGQTDTGGRRGFRLSPERRLGGLGVLRRVGRAARFEIVS